MFDIREFRAYLLRETPSQIGTNDNFAEVAMSSPLFFERRTNETPRCTPRRREVFVPIALMLFAAAALLALPLRFVLAQDAPGVSAVDPESGKVNDTITVTGANLGKSSISAVFLSDDKNDYKAVIVSQEDTKITMKVPEVKAGSYNISIQKGNSIFIQPVRFKVQ